MRALFVLVLLAGPAFAGAPKGPHPAGAYGGVEPGQAPPTKPGKHRARPPKGTLSWIGFTAKDGASEVFLQSVAPFQVDQRVVKGTLVVDLPGLTRLGHNLWRPIYTRFFDTPLARIVARRVRATRGRHGHAAGIELHIAFKHDATAAQASVRTATGSDGYFYAYLDFAAGQPAQTSAK